MLTTRGAVLAVLALGIAVMPSTVAQAACWAPPVVAPVTDPFRPPACRWCPGNRGIEYDTRPGQVVRAVATGQVSFAGSVAGTTYVVVEHPDGRRVTYGGLATRRHDRDDVVLRGQVVGTTTATFHLGLRIGERYVDPAPWIGRYVGRPRLVPSDGSRAAPAPPPRLRCRAGAHAGS